MALPAMRAAGEAPATDQGDPVVLLLGAILAELRLTRTVLERLGPPRRLGRADLTLLRQLLPSMFSAFGGEPFATADVVALRLPAVRGRRVETIGRLLGRAADAGEAVDDLLVERAGQRDHAVSWRIRSLIALDGGSGCIRELSAP